MEISLQVVMPGERLWSERLTSQLCTNVMRTLACNMFARADTSPWGVGDTSMA